MQLNPITPIHSPNPQPQPAPIRLPATASSDDVVACIRQHGYVIIEELAPLLTRQAELELEPHFSRSPMGTGSFTGEKTQRVARLVARSAACRQLIVHPLILDTVQTLFLGHCYQPQLALTQAIRIHPGQLDQELHRDDNVFPFRHPRPPAVLFSNWAFSDFTAENGATRLIPGSHTWDDERSPDRSPAVSASMSRGSVLLWEGATYHSGGSNTGSDVRSGALVGYNLGWLRQYENQYLAVPPELARSLTPELQALLGYQNHGYLGTYEGQDPRLMLRVPDVELPAPIDLLTSDLAQLPRQRH